MRRALALVATVLFAVGCYRSDDSRGDTPPPASIDGGTDPSPGPDAGIGVVHPPSAAASRPISGGTLIIVRDGRIAVAADPDRDAVFVGDLFAWSITATVRLEPGDEPGRLVEDGAGRVHVALRRGGAVATIDIEAGEVVDRRAVCPAPRGIAYDARLDALHVACTGGELVTLPAAGGAPTRTLPLDRDLRDVVVDGTTLYVSRFRSAEVLVIDASGTVVDRLRPQRVSTFSAFRGELVEMAPSTAWRIALAPGGGGVVMLHQRALSAEIPIGEPGSYAAMDPTGSGGSMILQAATTTLRPAAPPETHPNLGVPVPVYDMAVDADGTAWMPAVTFESSQLVSRDLATAFEPDVPGGGEPASGWPAFTRPTRVQITAIALRPGATPVGQSREPAGFVVDGRFLSFDTTSVADLGHDTFHFPTRGGLACAGCHPEGGDDGHVWSFLGLGPRRTQALRGGILATAPFHWDGDLPTLGALVEEVFVNRMGGGPLDPVALDALARFLDTIPLVPRELPRDPLAVERGRALFESTDVGCATCHSGAALTNNGFYDVGTGGRFQVPSLLNVAERAPFIHDGCAPTLRDRFTECGGGDDHGRTSHLTSAQLDDLVAYLETL